MANRPIPQNIQNKELFDLMERYNLTYAQLARMTSFSRDYISKLVQEKRPLTRKFTLKVLEKLILKCYK